MKVTMNIKNKLLIVAVLATSFIGTQLYAASAETDDEMLQQAIHNPGQPQLDLARIKIRLALMRRNKPDEYIKYINDAANVGNINILKLVPDESLILAADHGFTPLMSAASNGQLKTVQFLLEKPSIRATINARSVSGTTALHHAVMKSSLNVVKYLCQNGADSDIALYSGETTLSLAKGSREIVLYLQKQQKKAKRSPQDASFQLPAPFARMINSIQIAPNLSLTEALAQARAQEQEEAQAHAREQRVQEGNIKREEKERRKRIDEIRAREQAEAEARIREQHKLEAQEKEQERAERRKGDVERDAIRRIAETEKRKRKAQEKKKEKKEEARAREEREQEEKRNAAEAFAHEQAEQESNAKREEAARLRSIAAAAALAREQEEQKRIASSLHDEDLQVNVATNKSKTRRAKKKKKKPASALLTHSNNIPALTSVQLLDNSETDSNLSEDGYASALSEFETEWYSADEGGYASTSNVPEELRVVLAPRPPSPLVAFSSSQLSSSSSSSSNSSSASLPIIAPEYPASGSRRLLRAPIQSQQSEQIADLRRDAKRLESISRAQAERIAFLEAQQQAQPNNNVVTWLWPNGTWAPVGAYQPGFVPIQQSDLELKSNN